ncbi:hypothetical protein Rhe02_20180 [Rhizocola hellebori]|uniref:Uncharacterized protein n=1 Tax=Rhizocola hellebori TaxID=1392758 RepID=A0A8J3Q600_9ACTN|nr:hypothetical protein [Rhizocola hellebori]GIH03951.1 hypothetical protein Rhe02_20180 [Rhizocola hellebori]
MGKLYVAAPEGQTWPIDLDDAEASIRRRWPNARFERPSSAVTGGSYLSFDVVVGGMPRYGTYVSRSHLTLSQGSPQDWAETIVWFLQLLPPGTPALAMAEDNPELEPVPSGASVQDVIDLYERLEQQA